MGGWKDSIKLDIARKERWYRNGNRKGERRPRKQKIGSKEVYLLYMILEIGRIDLCRTFKINKLGYTDEMILFF